MIDLIPKNITMQQLIEFEIFCKAFGERQWARGMAELPKQFLDPISEAYYKGQFGISFPGDPTPRDPLDTSKYYSAYPHPATVDPIPSIKILTNSWPKLRTPNEHGPARPRLYFLTFEGFRYAVIEQNEDDAVSIVKDAADAAMVCAGYCDAVSPVEEKDSTVTPEEELAGELECRFTDQALVDAVAADLIKRGWRRDPALDQFQKE